MAAPAMMLESLPLDWFSGHAHECFHKVLRQWHVLDRTKLARWLTVDAQTGAQTYTGSTQTKLHVGMPYFVMVIKYKRTSLNNKLLLFIWVSMYVVSVWTFFFLIQLFVSSLAIPHKSRSRINYTGGIPWFSRYKECHCGGGSMRCGWVYIEPLWYMLSSVTDGRRLGRVQRRSHCPAGQTGLGPESESQWCLKFLQGPSKRLQESVCLFEIQFIHPSSQ